ncbi:hypothetical protein B0A49_03036 [Cryomyces minteri]|uniref:Uncharacterized protein n=1 Tax=Cryomyces minteri TaxID=331657 RepID=A0A4U0XC96_9PEZI|nr:hypothetical protein B0A49_03036 [Cryomyces minteri]
MPIRNPFRKIAGGVDADENARPTSRGGAAASDRGFQKTDVVGSKPTSAVNINKEPTEYKLSEINDSGVYLPVCAHDLEDTRTLRDECADAVVAALTSGEKELLAQQIHHFDHIVQPP